MKMGEDYPARLFGMRRAKHENYSPDFYCEPSETMLASSATLDLICALVGGTEHVRYCDVAPFLDGSYSKDKSCKPPKIMKDAGEFTFTNSFNSPPETRTDVNFIRGQNTADAFFAAVKKKKEERGAGSFSLFEMKLELNEKTGLWFAQEAQECAGVFLLRERDDQDKYYFFWYFMVPSPTASTKKMVLKGQTDALLQTLRIVNEFIRLLGGKPWGERLNPLMHFRGSGNPLRDLAVHHYVVKYAEEENVEEFLDAKYHEELSELNSMRQA